MPHTATVYLLYSSPPNTLSLRTLPLPLTPATSREAFLSALRTTTDLPLADHNVTLYWTHPHGAIRIAGGSSQTTTLLSTAVPVTVPVPVAYQTWCLSTQQLHTPWAAILPYGQYLLGSSIQSGLVASPALGIGVGFATGSMAACIPSTTTRAEPLRLDVSALVNRVDLRDVTEEQWPVYLGFGGENLRLCVVVDVEGARAGGRAIAAGGVDAGVGSSSGQGEGSAEEDARPSDDVALAAGGAQS